MSPNPRRSKSAVCSFFKITRCIRIAPLVLLCLFLWGAEINQHPRQDHHVYASRFPQLGESGRVGIALNRLRTVQRPAAIRRRCQQHEQYCGDVVGQPGRGN